MNLTMEKTLNFGETTLTVAGVRNKSPESESTPGVDEFEPEGYYFETGDGADVEITILINDICDLCSENGFNLHELLDEKLNQ